VDDVARLQTSLHRRGFRSQGLLVVKEQGAAHDENAWAERFPRALQFLYGYLTTQK
jgi:hypothetical protein